MKKIVPDTSVIIDGRITKMVRDGELKDSEIIIPEAVVSELEFQANEGRETGYNGLDEIVELQEIKDQHKIKVRFEGGRPTIHEIELSSAGEIDAMIRQVAVNNQAQLYTSDRVQARVASAKGIDVEYVRPKRRKKISKKDVKLLSFFDDETMSIHFKWGCVPYAKKGTPGNLRIEPIREKKTRERELSQLAQEVMEAAKRDPDSFIEIERRGATIVQLGPVRVAIARQPFSDGTEITAVQPVIKLKLEEYDLAPELKERFRDYQRGVFISGPPGSGKSTFAQSVAEWLHDEGTVVKTMESPRDLQVPQEITQYAPLEGSMELTSDVLLLVRPDFVVYDEVRKTEDFAVFADMRLAGVGLVGVTHANRAIDAVQRLIGRVELGMIPQVVDTVIHIEKGAVQQVLELGFTVKVPYGMAEADLARPVIEVRDFLEGTVKYEIYSYGEQVVVMPVKEGEGISPVQKLAGQQVKRALSRLCDGRVEIRVTGDHSATAYVEDREVPRVIGKGGKTVTELERQLGMSLDIQPITEFEREPKPKRRATDGGDGGNGGGGRAGGRGGSRGGGGGRAQAAAGAEGDYRTVLHPQVRKAKKNVILALESKYAGETVDVLVNGEVAFSATVGKNGDIRVSKQSNEAQQVMKAVASGRDVTVCF